MAARAAGYATTPDVHLVDDRGARIPLRPAAARLLTVLLRHPGGTTAEQLIAALWPLRPPDHPDAALRTVLSRLRTHLPDGVLILDTGRYRLDGLPGHGHVPPPLVGRDADLHAVDALLRAHDRVLITGPAGVGRSRMLDEVHRLLLTRRPPAACHVIPTRLGDLAGESIDVLRQSILHSSGQPVLLLDDAHRTDRATETFLEAIADLRPPRLVATARDGARPPESDAGPLRSQRWRQHRLGPLTDDDARALARSLLPQTEFDPAVAEGNPEMICVLAGGGRSRSLADTVRTRLDELPAECADALDLVVLAGELTWPMADAMRLGDSLSALESADLVVAGDTGVRPRSGLVVDTAWAAIRPARRRALMTRLLEATDDPVRRVAWATELGRPVTVDDLLTAAGFRMRAGDPDGASDLLSAAWSRDPRPDIGFSWAHAMMLGTAPGVTVAQTLSTIAASLPGPAAARIGTIAAVTAFLKEGDLDEARRRLAQCAPDEPLTALAASLIATYTGTPDIDGPTAIRDATVDPTVRGAAWSALFLARDLRGDVMRPDELPPVARAAADGLAVGQLHAMSARALLCAGDLDGARAAVVDAANATDLADLRLRAWLLTLRSQVAFHGGDHAAAVRHAADAAGHLTSSGHRSDERLARQWLALTAACAGDLSTADDALAAARELPAAAVTGEHHADLAAAVCARRRGRPHAPALARAYSCAADHGIADNALFAQVEKLIARIGAPDPRAALTPREREVLALYADRLPAREIAEELGISIATVRNHVARGFAKLSVHSRRELRALGDL